MSWSKLLSSSALSLVLSAIMVGESLAESRDGFYWGLDAQYLDNAIGGDSGGKASFSLGSAGLRAGFYLEPQLGLELYAAVGVEDDRDLGIDMGVESLAGILGRFESRETEEGFKLFLLLGYGMTELEMQRTTTTLPDRELYHGFVYGGGAEFRLGESDSFINIQGLRHYDEDDLSLDGISLGIRQGF